MQKKIILLTTVLVLVSCTKWFLWPGKKEMVTVSYSNSANGPVVGSTPTDISKYVSVDAISAVNLGDGTVQIILDGVRVSSKRNNYQIEEGKIKIFERTDGDNWEQQSEFDNLVSTSKTDVACVLVLDMSSSLSDVVGDLKTYAKDFIDKIVSGTDNSQVAVVFFSSGDAIEVTPFYTSSNIELLKAQIDNFDDYQDRTALYQASLEAISILDNLNFSGPKSLVIFTDGRDNDTDNPSTALSSIKSSEYLRVAIGLKGKDFEKDEVSEIASNKQNFIVAKNKKDLKKVFEDVALQMASVYRIVYNRSDQQIDNIEIKFEFGIDKIK